MVTPALPVIAKELGIPEGFMRQLVMTIFLLGYAQGPFVLAPLSEIYGRVTVLQYANLIYLVFNTACGFAQTKEQMLAFRFLSGIGGAAPQAVSCRILSNSRNIPLSYRLLTIAAVQWRACRYLAQGRARKGSSDIRYAYVDQSLYSTYMRSIHLTRCKLAMDFLGNLDLHCTRTGHCPFLSSRNLRSRHSGKEGKCHQKGTQRYTQRRCRTYRVRNWRPLQQDFAQATHLTVHHDVYASGNTSALNLSCLPVRSYVSHAFNFPSCIRGSVRHGRRTCIAQLSFHVSRFHDWSANIPSAYGRCKSSLSHCPLPLSDYTQLYASLKSHYGLEEGLPEFRVPPMILAGILCPIGLLIYGWTAQAGVHWIAPNIGCVIVAIGMIIGFQCSQAYTTDAYEAKYAASAAAVGAFMRTMCGFSFPLFAVQMYATLGLGWGNSLLAFMTLGLALVSPVLLWFYGPKLRAMSTKGLL